jgi:topoisomerase-4 subunit B
VHTENRNLVGSVIFEGQSNIENTEARLEWAVCWPTDDTGLVSSYCNTVPTPNGGSHIIGMRSGLTKALKSYGELTNKRKVNKITAEDVCDGIIIILSLFIPNPQFQGQTKERLSMPEAARLVESQIKDHFDLFLSSDTNAAEDLLEWVIEKAEERKRKKDDRELVRKSPTRKLRLPGKLSDCANRSHEGTELFIVEGDSAGGSAKQARNRQTQAILPLRGKILNVASATSEKLATNQELKDLTQALGCGSGKDFQIDKLRYERVIIMTDADVDGAHIASLLMTFFYRVMPKLVTEGHLYIAVPPLYRLSRGGNIRYAQNDFEREEILAKEFSGNGKVEISRFKGLGEMPPNQLKETTMSPEKRSLIQVVLPTLLSNKNEEKEEAKITAQLVEHLMGRKPEKRFNYIQENAQFVSDVDI